MNALIKYGFLFLILLIVQVFILNGMNFLGYATPFIYIYFILKLPVDTNKNLLIFTSFLLGLAVDIFCNTQGVNAAASVLVGFLRPYLIHGLTTLDISENREPSIALFGLAPFLRYTGIMIFLHHVVLLSLESFSLFNPLVLLFRIAVCSIFTFVLVWGLEYLGNNNRRR